MPGHVSEAVRRGRRPRTCGTSSGGSAARSERLATPKFCRLRFGGPSVGEPADSVVGPIAARLDEDLDTASARAGARRWLRSTASATSICWTRSTSSRRRRRSATSAPSGSRRGPCSDPPRLAATHEGGRPRGCRRLCDGSRCRATRSAKGGQTRPLRGRVGERIFGKRARRLVKTAKRIQTILGDHHDTVVERELLRRVGREAHLAGEDTFTFGRLDALAEVRADELDQRWRHEWSRISKPRTGRWS